jgi:Ca2+/Na+ antiporter
MSERFYVQEEKSIFTAEAAEQANASAKKQMRSMFFMAVVVCLFFGSMCYGSTSMTNFLVYVVVAGLFLFGLWRFNKRVENNEQIKNAQKQILPAEEMSLDENGISWLIKKDIPEKIEIAWENIIAYGGGFIEHQGYRGREKLSAPRVVSRHDIEVVKFLEQYTKLRKIVKKQYIQGEEYDAIYYEK